MDGTAQLSSSANLVLLLLFFPSVRLHLDLSSTRLGMQISDPDSGRLDPANWWSSSIDFLQHNLEV
jgi:hypothetical protein